MEEEKIRELEAKVNTIQGEITILENKNSDDELEELTAEVEKLNARSMEEEKIHELEAKVNTIQGEITILENKNSDDELEELTAKVEKLNARSMEEEKIHELEAKVNTIQGEITILENKNSDDELEELMAEVEKLNAMVNTIQGEITILENENSDDELEELTTEVEKLNSMVIWMHIASNKYHEKIGEIMMADAYGLAKEEFQKIQDLIEYRKEWKETLAKCDEHEAEIQKCKRLLNKHNINIDDVIADGKCSCTTFKQSDAHARKMERREDLIRELEKIGGICLTIGAMQMFDKRKDEEKSTNFMKLMIPVMFGGLFLLILCYILSFQKNITSISWKRWEKISQFSLIVVYLSGLAVLSYTSLSKGKPLVDLVINLI